MGAASRLWVVPIEILRRSRFTHFDLFVDSHLDCADSSPHRNGLMPLFRVKRLNSILPPTSVRTCKIGFSSIPKADLVEVSSTTKAAQIAKQKAHGAAAMGGHWLLSLMGSMLDEYRQCRNTTRFLVISLPPQEMTNFYSLFGKGPARQPGFALQLFNHNVNMSKIESRPSKNKTGNTSLWT